MPTIASAQDALRHLLVALSDRFEHAIDEAPEGFAAFDAGEGVRSPLELIVHLAGLMRLAEALWSGQPPRSGEPQPWGEALATFRDDLRRLDAALRERPTPTGEVPAHRILQGPLLDALTHVGQLTTLRRLAGAPVAARRYWLVAMAELEGAPD